MHSAVPICQDLPQFCSNLRLRTAVHAFALGTRRSVDRVLSLPTTIFALLVGSLTVCPFALGHAHSSSLFDSLSANVSTLSGSYSHPAAVFTARNFRASARFITPCLLRPNSFDTCPVVIQCSSSLSLTIIPLF